VDCETALGSKAPSRFSLAKFGPLRRVCKNQLRYRSKTAIFSIQRADQSYPDYLDSLFFGEFVRQLVITQMHMLINGYLTTVRIEQLAAQ
jgi:hypothetical protein